MRTNHLRDQRFGPRRAALELGALEISAKNLMFSSSQFIKFGNGANANCQAQFAFLVEPFQEMFSLLEEHAPTWYTEEHHRRAVATLDTLFNSLRETDRSGDNLSTRFATIQAIPSPTRGQVIKRRGFLFSAIKRRFSSLLMAWPNRFVPCSLPPGHKGPTSGSMSGSIRAPQSSAGTVTEARRCQLSKAEAARSQMAGQ